MNKTPPYVSDDFQIGPDGAFEYIEDEIDEDEIDDDEIWDVTLLDGLDDLDDI